MTNETLPIKKKPEFITIQRGKHNKENPYVQISRKMLRDPSISPKSKGVLCYLLSLPDNWKAHPREVAKSMGVGKDQIYSILKELIVAGYATRTDTKGEKGKFGSTLYEFYEEKLEVPQVIKEKNSLSGNPDTGNPDTGNRALRKKEIKKNLPEESNSSLKVPDLPKQADGEIAAKAAEEDINKSSKQKVEKSDFSPKVREVSNQMINSLVRIKHDYILPKNLTAFMTHIDYMLRLDKRDPIKLLDVFNWALSDNFWCDKMFKPNPAEYLRGKFDEFEMKMKAKPVNTHKQIDRRLKDKDGNPVDAYKDELF